MYNWLASDQKEINAIIQQATLIAADFLNNQHELPPSKSGVSEPFRSLPENGIGTQATLELFKRNYASKLGNSAGPRYFGFVTGGSTPASIVADWLVSTYDNNLSHYSGGVGGFIEQQTVQFLKDLFGLDEAYSGTFVTGATMSNFVGIASARQWVGEQHNIDISEQGLSSLPKIIVASGTPHSSIIKSLSMAGLGRKSIRKIETLPNREAVSIDHLRELLQETEGPAIVVANAGTVNTVDFDDLEEIGKLKSQFKFWLHIDAAFGGFAGVSEKYAHLVKGINHADSITIDAHKWLNVPYDSALHFTRHKNIQAKVFQNQAPYLGDASASPDFLHYTPENSRRFRALPAWFSLMAYGKEGYKEIVERNCSFALALGNLIDKSSHFKLLAPVMMNVVCFTLSDDSVSMENVQIYLAELHKEGKVFLTPTIYKGVPGMRAAISNWQTTETDLTITWESMEKAAQSLENSLLKENK